MFAGVYKHVCVFPTPDFRLTLKKLHLSCRWHLWSKKSVNVQVKSYTCVLTWLQHLCPAKKSWPCRSRCAIINVVIWLRQTSHWAVLIIVYHHSILSLLVKQSYYSFKLLIFLYFLCIGHFLFKLVCWFIFMFIQMSSNLTSIFETTIKRWMWKGSICFFIQ